MARRDEIIEAVNEMRTRDMRTRDDLASRFRFLSILHIHERFLGYLLAFYFGYVR